VFVDQAIITVQAGNGGDGCLSFYRAKYLPKGGPDGGDGGNGGSVIAEADPHTSTLLDFRGTHHWTARNGEPGRGSQQYGAYADDLVIRVPPGTLIYNDSSGELVADVNAGDRVVIAKGGKGGFGNEHYKSSTNQAPRNTTQGVPGERKQIRLELKLIADAGFIGLPNAGKSTLLSTISKARPKIADYPFTTLSPQLGIAELDSGRRLVCADIPGLIEGAAEGAGLGHDFLRHIERTRVLVHLLDSTGGPAGTPAECYKVIRKELADYSQELAEKPELIVLSKTDLVLDGPDQAVRDLRSELRLGHDAQVIPVSSAVGDGVRELLEATWAVVHPVEDPKGWSV